MLSTLQYRVTIFLSLLALTMVLANIALIVTNQGMQQKLSANNQFIQQSAQLEPIYQTLIRDLANAAANGNTQIGTLLSSQGITLTANPRENGK